ncbi:MAG: methyl-accepting chemotaxis protein [Acidobacteriota bacterium]
MTDPESTLPMTDETTDPAATTELAFDDPAIADLVTADPATTDDISAAPPTSRGLGGLLLAALVPVVAQAVAGALFLRQALHDAEAIATSTRWLGMVGLGALVLAVLVAWVVGRRRPAPVELDPVLAAVDHGAVDAARAATRSAEGERDSWRQRVEVLEATVADAVQHARTRLVGGPAPSVDHQALAGAAGRVAAGARAASATVRSFVELAAADDPEGEASADPTDPGDRPEIIEAIERLETLAAEIRLLALNAAIEASGVGDEGARFAVVADEVRRSSDEARAITRQLGTLVRSVGGGVHGGGSVATGPDPGLVAAAHEAARAADAVVELAEAHAGSMNDSTADATAGQGFGAEAAALEQLADRLDHVLGAAVTPVSFS